MHSKSFFQQVLNIYFMSGHFFNQLLFACLTYPCTSSTMLSLALFDIYYCWLCVEFAFASQLLILDEALRSGFHLCSCLSQQTHNFTIIESLFLSLNSKFLAKLCLLKLLRDHLGKLLLLRNKFKKSLLKVDFIKILK